MRRAAGHGLAALCLLLVGCAGGSTRLDKAEPAPFTSLVPQWDRVAMRVAGAPEPVRVAAYLDEIVPLLPDFYRPRGPHPERFGERAAAAFASYPAERARIMASVALIEQARGSAGVRFRRAFPDYRPVTPVYLVYSLGQLDGGTRTIDGRVALLFGADVIAKHHDATSIAPLFDHELFHTYHGRFFPECPRAWCALWGEGLAVYVAARMNPDASDRALLLTQPVPLRGAVDSRWAEAVATIRAHLDDADTPAVSRMFASGGDEDAAALPERYGYYVG